jgi:DNA-directed RNA polymerase subunit RPC12/RpoP
VEGERLNCRREKYLNGEQKDGEMNIKVIKEGDPSKQGNAQCPQCGKKVLIEHYWGDPPKCWEFIYRKFRNLYNGVMGEE